MDFNSTTPIDNFQSRVDLKVNQMKDSSNQIMNKTPFSSSQLQDLEGMSQQHNHKAGMRDMEHCDTLQKQDSTNTVVKT